MGMLADVGAYLEAHSIGTVATDIWLGEMQPQPDDAVVLCEYAGATPEVFDRTEYPSLQVRVRARLYVDAETKIDAIYNLLHGLAETDLSGTRYNLIAAKQKPFSLGQVDRELHELACNFRVIRQNAAYTPPSER